MRYVVAVSGGVDSVVLLDTFVRTDGHELIVAHFDHGIRDDSAADARFVEALAKKYDIPFVMEREELGRGASEELARARRYTFLRSVARQHDGVIVTAHHADDVVETIAINMIRGTGWRGLAVLSAHDIRRPLLHYTKQDIYDYALHHRLEWVEDSTNAGDDYLRNRVRRVVSENLPEEIKQEIIELWRAQRMLKADIDTEVESFTHQDNTYSRYLFTQLDAASACELLRAAVYSAGGVSPTRPQAERLLLAVKTARANTQYELNAQTLIRFTLRTFIVETP
jgi:tRNA(Ile)-lysidine synthase